MVRFRSRHGVAAMLVSVSAVAAACAAPPPPPPVVGPTAPTGQPCNVAAVRSCALPFPSDELTVPDASAATGRRLDIPEGQIPSRLTRQLGPGASIADVVGDADGFSALTPVMFEFDRAVRPADLPLDGGEVLSVHDAATGERIPIRTEVSYEARRHGGTDTIVVAWPQTRYEFGRTYLARVSDALRASDGSVLARAAGLDDPSRPFATWLRSDVERIMGPAAWPTTLSATRFTIRSAANGAAELDAMAKIVRSEDHPVRIGQIERSLITGPDVLAVVHGTVQVSDFRDKWGSARAENGATGLWVPFIMTVPRSPAGSDGAPVVIYGHGLGAAKESMLVTASANARRGLATISIDIPNHGERVSEGGLLFELADPSTFGRLASVPLQGTIDQLSLLLAVQHHLDLTGTTVPAGWFQPAAPLPPLDTSMVLYEGTSMGGVLGAGFVALAPELDGAFLQVAGTGIADTIFHSLLWPVFMGVLPRGAVAGDSHALMGAATLLLDHADNVNVVERIKAHGTPLFLMYGIGDAVVPPFATERMVALLDLPIVGPQIAPVSVPHRRTGSSAMPADGTGFAQVWPLMSSDELRPFQAHLAFAEGDAETLLDRWLEGRLASR